MLEELKFQFKNHPLIGLIAICLSLIAGTSTVNWFLFQKIITERHKLEMQEKHDIIRRKNNQIDKLQKYKNEMEEKIEPYKQKIRLITKHIEEQTELKNKKEKALEDIIFTLKRNVGTLKVELTSLKGEAKNLKDTLKVYNSNKIILQKTNSISEEIIALESELGGLMYYLGLEIHFKEKCTEEGIESMLMPDEEGDLVPYPCTAKTTLGEIELKKSRIEWLKYKITSAREEILVLQKTLNTRH